MRVYESLEFLLIKEVEKRYNKENPWPDSQRESNIIWEVNRILEKLAKDLVEKYYD